MHRRIAVVALLLSGCSWSRFDDVQDDAPVVLLNAPGNVHGFGASLATVSAEGRVLVLVGGAARGANGAALFSLGDGQSPATDSLDAAHCGQGCFMAKSIAGLSGAQAPASQRSSCFATGYTPSSISGTGILVRCDEEAATPFEYTLALPAGVSFDPAEDDLRLASDASPLPALIASAAGHAWFYAPGSLTPAELTPTTSDASFGAAIAARAGGFAVGAPEQAHVWLFDATGAASACLSGPVGFGRTLAAGRVDGDGSEDLVVADGEQVHVISGAVLAQLTDPSSCVPVQDLVTLACRSTADLQGCGGSDFGAALAVGDIDGDGDGEVFVGAPGMSVRGEGSGGAVLTFDAEGQYPERLTEARFIASAESSDRLGTSLVMAHQADRDLLVAGGSGGKAAVFYCSKLLPAAKRGSRCK
ncbi:MAG: FG-GAP repeat protein [Myxococcales bacterium]|nr:FG-GAP repeat protein [Myxococcales bacterium]